MRGTKKLLPTMMGLAVFCLGLAFPSPSFAMKSEVAVGEAQNAPQSIAERRYANHLKGLQWLGMSNKGEYANPDDAPIFLPNLEYPGGSGTIFLFSGGLWVGAVKNGIPIVSTCTDGDNGTGEYGSLEFATPDDYQPGGLFSVGWLQKTKDPVTADDQELARRDEIYLGIGVKEKDDDGDWVAEYDVDMDGKASSDIDGVPGIDDDGDGLIDEETLNGVDDDGDGLIDEDVGALDETWVQANAADLAWLNDDWTRVAVGDANGDGIFDYDPEQGIDEDPAGDMSLDYIDNDHDGLFDHDDPDYDGDLVPGSLDDDGDGLFDEDDLARAGQEFITAYADTCEDCLESADEGYTPLGVRIVQHSYQWSESYADDFIMMDFEVTNIGNAVLQDVAIGTFFDFDIGSSTGQGGAISEDDITYYIDEYQMAIGGDDDGDDGTLAAQFFGVRVIQTPLEDVQATYKNFNRQEGGDPEGNLAKYQLMVSGERDPDRFEPKDWRFILAFGPLGDLNPGETLPVTVAIVNGFSESEIRVNGFQAKQMYDADFRGPSAPDAPIFLAEAMDQGARIRWNSNAEASVDPISAYEDFQGYNIWRSPDALNWILVATYDKQDSLGFNAGWPPPPSSDSDYDYEIVESGLANGFSARYVVTAFDDGGNGDGIHSPEWDERNDGVGILESSRGSDEQQLVYPAASTKTGVIVDEAYVVPNPYVGSSRLEEVPRTNEAGVRIYAKDIEFRGLPGECDIQIFTLSGDLVQELHHDNGLSWEAWDLRTRVNQEIHAGIYIYRVSSGDKEFISKFVVVK